MNFINIFGLVLFSIVCWGINTSYAEIDPYSDLIFFQTGQLHTEKNVFTLSNDIHIREFFNGEIIRVSGQTIEGFPYITYSKINNDEINTFGKIFINGEFVKLSFIEDSDPIEEQETKNDDLDIVAQYTQRAHSKQFIFIDVKIFEKEENKYINFNQNYGFVANTDIKITITNENNQEIFTVEGITNDKGLFETKYLIPDNSKIETLQITINAEKDNSQSSKILQAFSLGNLSLNNG